MKNYSIICIPEDLMAIFGGFSFYRAWIYYQSGLYPITLKSFRNESEMIDYRIKHESVANGKYHYLTHVNTHFAQQSQQLIKRD